MPARPFVARMRGRRRFAIVSAAALAAGVAAALIVAANAIGFPYSCSGGDCSGSASDSIAASFVCAPGTVTTYFENSELPADALNPTLTKFTIGPPDPPCTGATISTPTIDAFPASLSNPDGTTATPKEGFAIFRFRFTVTVPANATPVGDLKVSWGISFALPPGSTSPTTVTETGTGTGSTSTQTAEPSCTPVLRLSKGTNDAFDAGNFDDMAALPIRHAEAVVVDDDASYVIVVENDSNCEARDVLIVDVLPAGFTEVSGVELRYDRGVLTDGKSVKLDIADRRLTYLIPSLGPHETVSLNLSGIVSKLGPQHNQAEVDAAGLDPVKTNTATITVTPRPRVTRGPTATATGASGTASTGVVSGGHARDSAPAGRTTAAANTNARDTSSLARLAQLAHVDVAVRRLPGPTGPRTSACIWLGAHGTMVRRAPNHAGTCRLPVWLRASGTAHWRYRFARRLARGRYELLVRVVNRGGAYDTTFEKRRHNLVDFTVRH